MIGISDWLCRHTNYLSLRKPTNLLLLFDLMNKAAKRHVTMSFRAAVREEMDLSSTHCHRITGAQQRSNGYSVKSRRQCQKLSEQPVTLSYDQYVFRPCDFNSSFGVGDFNSTNVQISIDNSPKSQYTYKVSVFRYNYNNINLRLWWNWQTR